MDENNKQTIKFFDGATAVRISKYQKFLIPESKRKISRGRVATKKTISFEDFKSKK